MPGRGNDLDADRPRSQPTVLSTFTSDSQRCSRPRRPGAVSANGQKAS
jgi:hypothetical protein